MRSLTAGLLLLVLAVVGCDQQAFLEKFIPKEEAEFARNYLALFQAHDFDAIEAKLDPSLRNDSLRPGLEKIASFFPADAPKDVKTIGSQSFTNGTLQQFTLTFQYEFPDRWLLASVVLKREGHDLVVTTINVQPLKESLETTHRFGLDGKGPMHFVVLLLAILVPVFIAFVVVLCARTPIPRYKWAWVLFVLLGLGQFSLNWTDGSFMFKPISFQLLGAGFFRASTFAPIILSVSFPFGALLFLFRRNSFKQEKVVA